MVHVKITVTMIQSTKLRKPRHNFSTLPESMKL